MNKVLCPIDFSSTSLNALEFAANFCKKANFQLVMINVFTEDDFMKVMDDATAAGTFQELKEMAESRLKEITKQVEDQIGVKITYSMRLGDLIETIEELDKQHAFDYIVMGTTGVSNMREAYMGSNTVRVLETVRVPVVCIPQNASIEPLDYIVYATDYSEEDKLILQELVSFSVMFKSRLKVVHVTALADAQAKIEHKVFTDNLASFVSYDKISFELIEGSNVATALDQYMVKNQADMLVLFKKKRGFIETILHRSLTKKMSYLTDYPLMVFKG